MRIISTHMATWHSFQPGNANAGVKCHMNPYIITKPQDSSHQPCGSPLHGPWHLLLPKVFMTLGVASATFLVVNLSETSQTASLECTKCQFPALRDPKDLSPGGKTYDRSRAKIFRDSTTASKMALSLGCGEIYKNYLASAAHTLKTVNT